MTATRIATTSEARAAHCALSFSPPSRMKSVISGSAAKIVDTPSELLTGSYTCLYMFAPPESWTLDPSLRPTTRRRSAQPSPRREARDAGEDHRGGGEAPPLVALAEHARPEQRGDHDRRLAPGRDDADRRERQRHEHEDVGQRAERGEPGDLQRLAPPRRAQRLAVAQRPRREHRELEQRGQPEIG